MKNFGKILTVLLALVIAVTVLVVIGAADDSGSDVTTVTTVEGFVAAVNAGKNIKLGGDLTLSGTFSVDGNLEVDLGGHTLMLSNTNAKSFAVESGDSLTLTGTGTINATIVAEVSNGGNLTINGTGNGIDLVQTDTSAPLFNLKAGSTTTLKGVVTAAPYKLASTRLFTVGETTTGLATKATLKVENATVTIKEPHSGTHNSSDNGMTFAYVSDGANIDISNSTITMEHGHFIQKGSVTEGTYVSSGVTGTSIDAKTLDGLTLPEGDNITIDITSSKISALNSGYAKALSAWSNSTSGGYLFNLNNVAVTVNVTDTELVGSNRTMTVGGTQNGVASQIYPAYFNFTNVSFTTSAFTTYDGAVLYGNFNVKWDGGIITQKIVSRTEKVKLGNGSYSDPYGSEAYEAAKAAGYEGTFDEFKTLYYAVKTYKKDESGNIVKENGKNVEEVTNTYYALSTQDDGTISGQGFRYSESTDGTKWCGILFKNCCFVSNKWISDTAKTFAVSGNRFENANTIKDGVLIKYRIAYLEKILVSSKTSYFDTAANYVLNFGSNSGNNGNTKNFEAFVENGGSERYGGYAEVKDGTNGYIKFFVDSTNTAVGKDTADNYNGIKYWGYNSKTPSYPVGNYKYFVHEFDLATDTGTYTTGAVSVFARYYAPTTEDKIYYKEGANQLTTVTDNVSPFKLENNALNLNSTKYENKTNNSELLQLPTDGSWARITLVYEINRTDATATFNNQDGTTTSVDAWDYSGTRLHVYRDGKWIGTMTNVLGGTKVPKLEANENSFALDSLRFDFQNVVGSSTCIDNNRLSAYTTSTDVLSAISTNASSVNLNNYKNDFLVMPAASKIEKATANVNWVIDGKTVGTTTPLAGSTVSGVAPEASVLAQANALRNELNNDWFDYGFSGWKVTDAEGKELTSTDTLTKDATYTFTAVCDKPIAPAKGVSGIKINLSLRLDFDLNFYVPVPDAKLDVSNIMIKKGTTKLDSGTINENGNTYVYGQEVTVYGNLYTKHRDSYGVAELGTRTYTLSYTVGSTVITQDITYGVSNYVAQYMQTSSASITKDQVPRELVMSMVNYVVKVVEHEDNKITKTEEINTIITNYKKLLKMYPVTATETTYFTENEGVLARIKVSRASVMGKTKNEDGMYTINTTATSSDLAYYVGGAKLYFSTGTPKFIFKYTDKALELGIKAPDNSGHTGWGGTGVWAYTGYEQNGTQGVHLALDKNGNKVTDKWGDSTVKDESVTYYATMIDTNFRGKTYAIYDMLRSLRIDLSYRDSETASDNVTWSTGGKYCIEWYINGLVTSNADSEDIDLAIALYDYACAAYKFVNGSAYSYDSYITEASYLK